VFETVQLPALTSLPAAIVASPVMVPKSARSLVQLKVLNAASVERLAISARSAQTTLKVEVAVEIV
jgi:hypothetical protein